MTPLPWLEHRLVHRDLGGVPVARQAHIQRQLPAFKFDIGRARPHHAEDRVVVQHVEAAEFVQREFDHRLDIRGPADVGLERLRLAARLMDLADNALRAFQVAIDDNYRGALARVGFCACRANPGTAARDQTDLVCQPHVSAVLSLIQNPSLPGAKSNICKRTDYFEPHQNPHPALSHN